jgi:hypothetical protein
MFTNSGSYVPFVVLIEKVISEIPSFSIFFNGRLYEKKPTLVFVALLYDHDMPPSVLSRQNQVQNKTKTIPKITISQRLLCSYLWSPYRASVHT